MPKRTRSRALMLGAAVLITAAGIPMLGGRAAATDRIVVVKAGQTLGEIAAQHGTTVAELAQLNGLADPDAILAGQQLRVRPTPRAGEAAPAAEPVPATITHRVSYGETLSSIAVRYGSSVTAIARASGLADPSFIRAGQVLQVPAAPGTAAAPAPAQPAAQPAGPKPGMSAPMAAAVARRQAIGQLIAAEARRQGVPAAFAMAVAWQESGWQAAAVSTAGAIGVMQLLPSTGEWVGSVMLGHAVNLWDPASNIRAGVRLLKHYLDRYGGDRALVLAAYYQGQSAVDRHGVFAVSRPYIASIIQLERIFSR